MAGMTAPPVVLATDFGLSDAYVGMMRGVIYGINPSAHVIDLTHGIGAQDVRHGAVVLADSFLYCPTGSIFVAVVDPGVGTDRAAIMLETPHARLVAPDNGLLTLVCRQYNASFGDSDIPGSAPVPDQCRAWRLTNPDYWRHPVSNTFHGRDVFAPVAAHLSLGTNAESLGQSTSTMAALALPIPRPDGNTITRQYHLRRRIRQPRSLTSPSTSWLQIGVSTPATQRAVRHHRQPHHHTACPAPSTTRPVLSHGDPSGRQASAPSSAATAAWKSPSWMATPPQLWEWGMVRR